MFRLLNIIKRIINIFLLAIFILSIIYFYLTKEVKYAIIAFSDIILIISLHFLKGKPVEKMTGKEFEAYCAKKIKRKGFRKITLTPTTGDFGADIIAYDWFGRKWVFQCKRFKGKVSNKAVQEVVASKAHYKADKAAVITNSELTVKARKLADENNVAVYEFIR